MMLRENDAPPEEVLMTDTKRNDTGPLDAITQQVKGFWAKLMPSSTPRPGESWEEHHRRTHGSSSMHSAGPQIKDQSRADLEEEF